MAVVPKTLGGSVMEESNEETHWPGTETAKGKWLLQELPRRPPVRGGTPPL